MAHTNVESLDSTIQKTNIVLNNIMNDLNISDKHTAYSSLRAVLHSIRDFLNPEEAVHLGSQLPMLIRGIYYEDWEMSVGVTHNREAGDFLQQVREDARKADINPEEIANKVLNVVCHFIDEGRVRRLVGELPQEVRNLFPINYQPYWLQRDNPK
jgi:uncharacterized protein (DUF2267 family)